MRAIKKQLRIFDVSAVTLIAFASLGITCGLWLGPMGLFFRTQYREWAEVQQELRKELYMQQQQHKEYVKWSHEHGGALR